MRTIGRAAPQDVHAFLAVVEAKSFRGAARELDIPKSTLSGRVRELEETLGSQLLVRTTRNVRLTHVGEAFYREASAAMDALRAASDRVLEHSETPRGRLRMTAPFELGQRFMGGVLSTFTLRYPQVRVELDLLDRQVNLVEEGYDLALRIGPLGDSMLVARRVGPIQDLRLYASPAYLESAGTPERPSDLKLHRCLVKSGGVDPRTWQFRVEGRAVSVPIEPTVEVNSFLVLTELAQAGAGIAALPRELVDELKFDLVPVLEDFASPERECFLVYPDARAATPAVRAMLELIVTDFGNEVWMKAKCTEALGRCPGSAAKLSAPKGQAASI
jgi:DNA-binding transcriptional LysR family regulator